MLVLDSSSHLKKMHALLAHLSHNMTQPYFRHSEFRLVRIMKIYYESRHLDFLNSSWPVQMLCLS